MNFNKRVNGSWIGTPHYIHNTSTDTITTLPAVLYPNDATATVGLKGQAVRSGTPTPQNPIMPQGCGERTGNLWNEGGFSARAITSTHEHTDTNTYGTTLSTTIGKETIITQSEYPTGTVGYQNGFFFIDVDFSKYEIGDKVTLSFDYICNEVHSIEGQISTTLYAGKNSNSIPAVLSSGKWSVSGRLTAVITIIADMNPYVEVRLCGNSITVKNIMLNLGSTALPYEPYGYKIPISSAGQTTPIYLGEVETTRKIQKLVLTGNENWAGGKLDSVWRYYIRLSNSMNEALCTHYKFERVSGGTQDHFYLTDTRYLYIFSSNLSTVADFKAYLAQQYAAGTPVCVWYVLATEETAVVNEPLMRIGDYADTVSNISIPVTAGGDTISVDTTVQPSEVTVNYKGWHPVQNVHEKSKNLFDKGKRTDNSRVVYTTGEIGALNGTFVSDFTPIEPNTTYTLNIVSSISGKTGHLFALYDENKDFVNTGAHEATSATVYTFTTPSNVAYIRFNGDMSSVDRTMLNSGNTALPYEPYWK